MDALEIQMCDACAREVRQGVIFLRSGPIEPADQRHRLRLDARGGWRLEVNLRSVEAIGHDLYRLLALFVATDSFDIAAAGHDHLMPSEQTLVSDLQSLQAFFADQFDSECILVFRSDMSEAAE